MRAQPGAADWPLVVFTVFAQAAAGVCLATAIQPPADALALWVAPALLAGGMAVAPLHLGRRSAGRLALANLRSSWLSRELLLALVFAWVLIARALVPALAIPAAVLGLALVVVIARVYLLRTVPPWNTWMTPAAFLGTSLLIGAGFLAALRPDFDPVLAAMALAVIACFLLLVAALHLLSFGRRGHGVALALRALAAILGATLFAVHLPWAGCALLLVAELLGRFLFYASHRRVGL